MVQNHFDQLSVALQGADLDPVGLDEIVLVQVQLWAAVHDVSDDPGQLEPLLGPRCVLVGLVVTVQELQEGRF